MSVGAILKLTSMALLVGAFAANAALIDSFDERNTFGGQIILNAPGSADNTDNGVTGVIGGQRFSQLTYISGGGLNAAMRIDFNNSNVLSISNDDGVVSTTLLRWNGNGALNADITDGGASSAFALNILQTDILINLTLTVTDINGNSATRNLSNLASGVILSQFNTFTNFAATDFSQVREITLLVSGPESADLRLDFIGTTGVPEPGTLAMVGAALLGLALYRRRSN